MHSTPEELRRILRRHPDPAVSVDEARTLIAESSPDSGPPDRESIADLSVRDPQLRLLAPPSRRWAGAGPSSWILVQGPSETPDPRSIEGRLRSSLRLLGQKLEPGSIRALARWERLLREERRVRGALRRRLRSRARARTAKSAGPSDAGGPSSDRLRLER